MSNHLDDIEHCLQQAIICDERAQAQTDMIILVRWRKEMIYWLERAEALQDGHLHQIVLAEHKREAFF